MATGPGDERLSGNNVLTNSSDLRFKSHLTQLFGPPNSRAPVRVHLFGRFCSAKKTISECPTSLTCASCIEQRWLLFLHCVTHCNAGLDVVEAEEWWGTSAA
jgi:hypothetical protein